MDPVGHSEVREGIQKIGNAVAGGHSTSKDSRIQGFWEAFCCTGTFRRTLWGSEEFRGSGNTFRGSRGMFRVLMGIQQKKRVKGVLG